MYRKIILYNRTNIILQVNHTSKANIQTQGKRSDLGGRGERAEGIGNKDMGEKFRTLNIIQ